MSVSDEIAGLLNENSDLRVALARCQRSAAEAKARTETLREAVFDAAKAAALSVQVPAAPKRQPSKRAEVALVHLTDWQLGKRTESYDTDTCKRRVMDAVAKVGKITQLHHVPVNEVVLLLGGDMVEGVTIFPGQAWEVESSLYVQLFECASLIAGVVSELLGMFSKVTVVEEYGNHGRIGRKGELPAENNIDLMAYRIAEMMVQSRRLTWQRATTWHQVVQIGEYRALLVHGDEIRSYGGNHPVYGIVRKVSAWQSGVIEGGFADCYMGHFHRPDTYTLPSGGSVYVTGSPESGNEYAREFMAATGRPSQRLHFVDPTRGRVTSEHRLWLD